MNRFSLQHENFNNGIRSVLVSPLNQDEFNSQFDEVFEKGHYEKGRYKKDMVIVDIGANMGLTALYFKDYAKTIYAIEPNPEHYQALVENTKQYDNIKPFKIAISGKNGKEYLRTNGPGLVAESFFGDGQKTEIVDTITLKDFMAQEGIEHIDLLKIDCEGAEYPILASEGFRNVADKIDVIIGEAHPMADLMPHFIPLMLEDVGFKTEWLPFENMFKILAFTEITSGEQREWKAMLKTLFLAKK